MEINLTEIIKSYFNDSSLTKGIKPKLVLVMGGK